MSAAVAHLRGPAEDRYQLPAGTYRELLIRTTKLHVDDLSPVMRELSELRRYLPADDVEVVRLRHATQQAIRQARVKADEFIDQALAAGRPVVASAWQVQVACHSHPLADAPSWLTPSASATVRVFADDTCEPASL